MQEPESRLAALIRIVRGLRVLTIELTGLLVALAALVAASAALIR
jgi:hypothetical protein